MKKNLLLCKSGKVILLLITELFFSFAYLLSDELSVKKPVEIQGSQVIKLNSSITGQEYVLYVCLPRGYEDTTRNFPAIYVLDGQWDFALVHALYGQQYYDGFIPGAIIVGITWGGENPDYDKRRAFDLTPTDVGKPNDFGNASNFLGFIKNEAIPYIDSRFRTKRDDRALIGSSFGGLFVLYTLLKESEVFNRYILTSPAWNWDNSVIYKYIYEFSNTKLKRQIRLYMAVGEYEDVKGFEKLKKTLEELKLDNLEIETKVIQGAGHSGAKAEGFTRGLQFVFARPCIDLDHALLKQYVGEYEGNDGSRVKMEIDGSKLVAVFPGGMRINICAESDKAFYVKGAFFNIQPDLDRKGNVKGFKIDQYNGSMFLKKVK